MGLVKQIKQCIPLWFLSTLVILFLYVLAQVSVFVLKIGPIHEMHELSNGNDHLLTNPYHQKYTIVVPTYKRLDLIKPFVEHHIQCPGVGAIHIVWNDVDSTPPKEDDFFDIDPAFKDRTVKFETFAENNLNNRFIPPEGLATDAVFNVDDDMVIPCEYMSAAFEAWMAAPNSLVGFAPRLHTFIDGEMSRQSISDRSLQRTEMAKFVLLYLPAQANGSTTSADMSGS
jgi:hypothetical protein